MYPLHILLLEDDPSDAELIQATLEADQFSCDVNVVTTHAEFLTGLEAQIDLVLADYKLPSFDGLSALRLSLSIRPDLPFIFVSGTFGEESAIEALNLGATDYVQRRAYQSWCLRCAARYERERSDTRLRRRYAGAKGASRCDRSHSDVRLDSSTGRPRRIRQSTMARIQRFICCGIFQVQAGKPQFTPTISMATLPGGSLRCPLVSPWQKEIEGPQARRPRYGSHRRTDIVPKDP